MVYSEGEKCIWVLCVLLFMGKRENSYDIIVGIAEGKRPREDLGVDGRIIL
jgi:hypothetical protein